MSDLMQRYDGNAKPWSGPEEVEPVDRHLNKYLKFGHAT